jgi:hypothetical protein
MPVSSDGVDPDAYEQAKKDVLDLILTEANNRVAAQMQLMLAADARASGILAGCITLAAGGLGFAVSKLKDPHLDALFVAALVFGIAEAVAAVAALTALWPASVAPQGWDPATFADDLGKSPERVKAEMARLLQGRIDNNRKAASRLAGRIKTAMLLAMEGPLVGLSAGLWAGGAGLWGQLLAVIAALVYVVWGVPLLPGAAKSSK